MTRFILFFRFFLVEKYLSILKTLEQKLRKLERCDTISISKEE